jgi:hypothetical protein
MGGRKESHLSQLECGQRHARVFVTLASDAGIAGMIEPK